MFRILKHRFIAIGLVGTLSLAGCEPGTTSGDVYYDSMLWNDYYYGYDRPGYPSRPDRPERPDRPDRPERPVPPIARPPGPVDPGFSRPPRPSPSIHRPAPRPRPAARR